MEGTMPQETPLKVWFVNVGHGDCTIVKFPAGRIMMVDISNSKAFDEDTKAELMKSAGFGVLDQRCPSGPCA
jgi:hypothetical protein